MVNNRNLAYLFIAIVAVVYFFTAFFVSADVGDSITIYDGSTSATTVQTWGNTSTRLGSCVPLTPDEKIYVSTLEYNVQAYNNSVTDNVIGVIWVNAQSGSNEAFIIATSTNQYVGVDLYNVGRALSEFTFEDILLYEKVHYCVGVVRTGTYNSSDRYQSYSDSSITDTCYVRAFDFNTTLSTICIEKYGTVLAMIYGNEYIESSCESGTIECDMASTTEAVYAVGTTTNFILGIFLCLIFGLLSYTFFKGYIT